MHTEKAQKKKGTRSRKRKAASTTTEQHERDTATVAASGSLSQGSPPHSCLTQNSDGRFVPRFSKKLRSASKVPSVTSSPAAATSELQSQQHSAEGEVEDKEKEMDMECQVVEREASSHEEKDEEGEEEKDEVENEEGEREEEVEEEEKNKEAKTELISKVISPPHLSLHDFSIPGMSLSQVVVTTVGERGPIKLSCSQPIKAEGTHVSIVPEQPQTHFFERRDEPTGEAVLQESTLWAESDVSSIQIQQVMVRSDDGSLSSPEQHNQDSSPGSGPAVDLCPASSSPTNTIGYATVFLSSSTVGPTLEKASPCANPPLEVPKLCSLDSIGSKEQHSMSETDEVVAAKGLDDSLADMDLLETFSMDFSEEVTAVKTGGRGGGEGEGGGSSNTFDYLGGKSQPHACSAGVENPSLATPSIGSYLEFLAEETEDHYDTPRESSPAAVPSVSPCKQGKEATVPTNYSTTHESAGVMATPRQPVIAHAPLLEEGTRMLRGLVEELSALNRFILCCKREMDAARRQRSVWLRSQQMSRYK